MCHFYSIFYIWLPRRPYAVSSRCVFDGPAVFQSRFCHVRTQPPSKCHTLSWSPRLCPSLCDFLLRFHARAGLWKCLECTQFAWSQVGEALSLFLPLTYLEAYAKGGETRRHTHTQPCYCLHTCTPAQTHTGTVSHDGRCGSLLFSAHRFARRPVSATENWSQVRKCWSIIYLANSVPRSTTTLFLYIIAAEGGFKRFLSEDTDIQLQLRLCRLSDS